MTVYLRYMLFLCILIGTGLPLLVRPALAYYGNNQYFGYLQNTHYRQRQQMMDTPMVVPDHLGADTDKIPTLSIKSCVELNNIEVTGVTKISKAAINTITHQWKGRCVSLQDINIILGDINKLYVKHRLVTSRAYLPKQDISGGYLKIIMLENKVGSFEFSGSAQPSNEITAFPWVSGGVLNLDDLEQGLDNMNRLSGWEASLKFLPKTKDTDTVVHIDVPKTSMIHGKVLTDNNSQSSSGRTMGRAFVNVSDLFGLLDLWSFEYDHSLNNRQSQGHNSFLDAEGSIPLGPWLLFGGWWRSDEFYYMPSQPDTKKRLDTVQKDYRIGVSRVIARHKVDVTTLTVSYELKDFRNNTNYERLPSQSAKLASLNIGVGEFLKIWGRTWYINIGAKVGLGGMGTKTWVVNQGKYAPHTQYVKPYLNIDGFKPITKTITWHTVIHGEYSSQNQYGNEWFSIGGPYTVRGFLKKTAIGNAGIFMRNDLSWQLPTKHLVCAGYDGFCEFFLKDIELYVIADAGMTRAVYTYDNMPKILKSANIAGTGIGLRKSDGILIWDSSVSHAISTSGLSPEGWIASFQVGVKL
ncbi:ShlB/FhaC/HecB family hemolysin secretion/activation protein [Commensalibacter papalotli (ex Botero et al. 2024)]|uniref:Hemolysin activation/secretion protein (FhaC) (PDB:2MHJ) n=1 Tax=Commensalibacter papalotli (ex Botero et al. 2024) TaxID=2972766 RepID=A0ABM9HQ91_9PROT|nr:ShlB/FhaC/HecB family hemolysin secretion/activation protein [Commensalibacter papalotli (ex Botero et al. 2024)]CAI3931634.1 Hemolysin activation/secretion protein (FhaC) (PDB:2MHJ) [Commensalibacter papalotli (ex Botero et al. 2024)]CAI3944051.1 Hemolysin activation/secretion protein (FhaC) (PDB:2MHJ) [Commensalibacter papalotli (ex Botero et al. 2024)]